MKNKKGQMAPEQPNMQEVKPRPIATEIATEPVVKKSKWWIWLIIALILVGIVVGVWLLLSGGDGGSLIGNSIPQPPPLPV